MIVITGASGFIGRQIIPILRKKGFDIIAVGRNPEQLAQQFPDLEVCSYDALIDKANGAVALVHLAVLNSESKEPPEHFHEVNVELLKRIVALCKQASIPQLIYTSTLHAGKVDTPYGNSKLEAEILLDNVDDLTITRLKLPAVYGQDQFQGKLKILNRVPTLLRPLALQTLRSIKPTVTVDRVAIAVAESVQKQESSADIISDGQADNWAYSAIKKIMDYSFAVIVLLVLWWLLLIVWLAVKMTSAGPGIFKQERVGRFGRTFTLYKFRTMADGTKQAGTHEVSNTSVTSIGRILRKTKIDELPQIWNILRGEISLVGPRPCLPSQSELVRERSSRNVLSVMPGITGYAQVRDIDMSDAVRLAKTDAKYIALRTIPLDIVTLLQTALGGGSGDRTNESQ